MTKFIKAVPGSKHSVIYTDSDGREFSYENGSRAWRNNNPGNLVVGFVSKRNGQIGKAGGFAVFPDRKSGHSALLDSLKSTHGNHSLEQMIGKYAPEDENDTLKYLKFLRNKTGIKDDKKIRDFTPEEFEKLWRAIETYEGSKEGEILEIPVKKKVTGVKRDEKGRIISYLIEDLGWLSKREAIKLAESGKIDVVVVHAKYGTYLRSRPDEQSDNNLASFS
jgi:hypothetical protein